MNVAKNILFLPLILFAQTPIPDASQLHDPAGHQVLFKLRTLPTSVQIYTCKATSGTFAWTGPDPDAILAGSDTTLPIVHHYKGPTWESTDGSTVHAGNAQHFRARRENSVDWLELTASQGTQKFAGIAYIHRVDTAGGIPPTQPCDAAHDQQQVRVPYSATYQFYAPKP